MKSIRFSFLLFLGLLFVNLSASAYTSYTEIYNWLCTNGNMATCIIRFGDCGAILGAAGVDCNGNVWSKNYELITTIAPNVTISSLSASVLTAKASDVDLKVWDMTTGEFVTAPVIATPGGFGGTISLDISGLTNGHPYGLFVLQDGKSAGFMQFQKL